MQKGDPLHGYLSSVRQLTGAASASLLLIPGTESIDSALLLHDGDAPPAPELEDIETAQILLPEIVNTSDPNLGKAPGNLVHCYQSADEHACLLRLFTAPVEAALKVAPGNEHQEERRGDNQIISDTGSTESVWIGLAYAGKPPAELADKLQQLEERLEAVGGPWTPGRIPTWELE